MSIQALIFPFFVKYVTKKDICSDFFISSADGKEMYNILPSMLQSCYNLKYLS